MFDIPGEEPQVLIVDDIASTRAILRDMLQELGFTQIVEATDGREALIGRNLVFDAPRLV
jgi:CheY-like chemotaxis protein